MNTVYIRIKELADENKMSLAQIERQLDLSNGIISSWREKTPNSEVISRMAKFFNVTTDYLLGNTNTREIDDSDDTYYRMDTDGLDAEQIDEIKEQLKIAEEIALRRMKKDR